MTAIWTPYGFVFDEDTAMKGIKNTVSHEEFMAIWRGEKRWWE